MSELLKPEHRHMKRIKFEAMVKQWLKEGKIDHHQSTQALEWYNKGKPQQSSMADLYPDEYKLFIDNYRKR